MPKTVRIVEGLSNLSVKGNPPILELLDTGVYVPLARLSIRRTQGVEIVQIMKEKPHVILFFENPFHQVRN